MKLSLIILILFCSIHLSAQVVFVETQNWSEILEMAEAEQMPIFFDAVTKWCKPCKVMEKKVFSDDKVAQFMKANFINVKIDMESEFGKQVNKSYNISVYPTLMVLNSSGQIEARHLGGLTTTGEFMEWITVYADNRNHKSVLEAKLDKENIEPDFLQYYAEMMSKSLFPNAVPLDQLYQLNPEKYYQFFIKEINTTQSKVLNSLKSDLTEDVLSEVVTRCQERIFYTEGINPKTLALSIKGKPEESYQAIYRYERR